MQRIPFSLSVVAVYVPDWDPLLAVCHEVGAESTVKGCIVRTFYVRTDRVSICFFFFFDRFMDGFYRISCHAMLCVV